MEREDVFDAIEAVDAAGYDLDEELDFAEALNAVMDGEIDWEELSDDEYDQVLEVAELVYPGVDPEDALDQLIEDIIDEFEEDEDEDDDDDEEDDPDEVDDDEEETDDTTELLDEADDIISEYLSDETRDELNDAINTLAKRRVAGLKGSGIRYKNRAWGQRLIRQAEDHLADVMADAQEELLEAYEDEIGETATVGEERQFATILAIDTAHGMTRAEIDRQTGFLASVKNKYANMSTVGKILTGAAFGIPLGLGFGVIGGGVAVAGVGLFRAIRGSANRRADGSKGSVDDFYNAYGDKLEQQIETIQNSTEDEAFDRLWESSVEDEDSGLDAEARSSRNRHAIYWGAAGVIGGAVVGEVLGNVFGVTDGTGSGVGKEIGGRIPNNPFDTFDGVPAQPGESQTEYFTRYWQDNMTSADRYNWGRMMEYGEQNPGVNMSNALERASASATQLSDEAYSRLGSALNSVQSVADTANAIGSQDAMISSARVGELEQWFAGGGHNQADVFYQFNALEQIYGAPYMDELHSNSSDLFQNPLLRKTLSEWYQINR